MDISNSKRSLKVERLYTLGDYKNIKFIDEINDLPESFITDPHAVDLIRSLQFAQCDLAFQNYYKMVVELGPRKGEELIALLEEYRTNTMEELKTIFANHEEK